jgi:recombination protein RecA
MLHSILASATTRGEICAIVDCTNAFDPASAAAAGADLERLLWVQAGGRLDHAMKAADLILHGGGFGVVALDLCEIAPHQLQRIPLSYWYRFRLAVEKTPSTFVVAGARPIVKSCAALQLESKRKRTLWSGQAPFSLLTGAEFEVASRKPGRIEPALLRAAV